MLARQAYVAGQHQRALLLARRVLSQRKRGDLAQQALRVLGSAGCQSGDRQAVRRALRGLGVRYRTMLIQVCRRVGHDVR